MNALLVIDMQQGMFADPALPPHDGEAIVMTIRSLIDQARGSGTPVFFVQHDGGPGDPLAAGTPGFSFHSDVAPAEGEFVAVKRQCSAFLETGLDAALKAAGIDHLVICGMQTEYCIDTTVRSAFERGYDVTLVEDGHTTFDARALKAASIVAHHNETLAGSFATVKPAPAIRFG